jgi:mRNA interferase MazF
MQKGDIYLVRFPFTDLSTTKLRPALLLINFKLDISVCFITSQLSLAEDWDMKLSPNPATGIHQTSLVKIGKIATINKNLVLGKLGSLHEDQVLILNQKSKQVFQIP